MSGIHRTAIVEDGAEIADGVEVGAYAIIGAGVRIASGTRIGPHAVVRGPTTIGRDNQIFQFASIGDDPQDKKYAGERTELVIGDRNTIREFCTINRGTAQDEGITRIGDDNWIMAYAHVAHDCVVGNHVILANAATLAGHVHVDDWVIFGGFAGVHQFVHIGAHAFLGMYSGVGKDIPAYVTVVGQPAEPRGINSEGLRRRGYTSEQIRAIKEAFRILYRSGLKLADAIEELKARVDAHPELQPMIDSIDRSGRSIVR